MDAGRLDLVSSQALRIRDGSIRAWISIRGRGRLTH